MKKFVSEYLNIIAYAAIGLAFVFSSFYLLINYYHGTEVSKQFYITESDTNYKTYKEKLNSIKENLSTYAKNSSPNANYNTMYTKLTLCSQALNEEGMLSNFEVNRKIKAIDIYNLGSKFQANALNACWAVNLSYLTGKDVPSEFKDVAPLIKNNIETITDHVSFAMDEIENNSSYFMTTSITSSTVRNYLSSDYSAISSSYNAFADIVLSLSKMINEEGGND